MKSYKEFHSLKSAVGAFPSDGNIDDYIKRLEENKIEYFEINTKKENGRKLRIVIPVCNLRNMKQSSYKKLLDGVL